MWTPANIGLIIILTITIAVVCSNIFSFFDIGFDVYGNYLIWIIALGIFVLCLPQRCCSAIWAGQD